MVEMRLHEAPEGTLRVTDRGKSYQYYHRMDPTDTIGTYIRKSDRELAEALAQKDYDQKAFAEIQKEMEALDMFLTKYQPDKLECLYGSLHKGRQSLIQPLRMSDEQYAAIWKSVEYTSLGFEENTPEHYTDAGERVRSKSEIIIANKLLKMNIPYRYEYPIVISHRLELHPDFYCLNRRTRKEYAWEHFGMMDDARYENNVSLKIEQYARSGYWLGDRLLATFESSRQPLNTVIVDQMIEKYLL